MDQAEEFAGLCELVWRILNNRQECFLRQFFICWFHDSKQADTGFDAGRSFFCGSERIVWPDAGKGNEAGAGVHGGVR